MRLVPSAQSSCQNKNFVNTSKKLLKKQKLNIPRSALFHMETRISLKHFVNGCSNNLLFRIAIFKFSNKKLFLFEKNSWY